jgi:hypothetical protein
MRTRAALAATAALPAMLSSAAAAQPASPADAPPPPASADQRIERLERRLDELDRQRQQELKARDEEIARLKAQLGSPNTRPSSQPASQPASQPTTQDQDEIERTKQDILRDIEGRGPFGGAGATTAPSPGGATPARAPVSFNPDIAVVSDFVASYSPHRSNDALNRADLREAELDIRAAVHPKADGVLVVAFARDVDNPIFPEAGAEPQGGPDNTVEVEEGYLFLHDIGVPNLTAKLGRFHVRFGRQNVLHLHDLPTTDPPFVNQAFLAPEALSDSGVSLSYVIPPDLIRGQYVEVVGEVLAGEGAASGSPTLHGDLSVDSPAVNTHVLWNVDVAPTTNLELGGSWLTGHADADNRNDVNLFGLDATLMRRDPTGGFRNTLLQTEAIYGLVDQPGGERQESFGAYVLGQEQLKRDWFTGMRLDWTQDPNDQRREAWGVTPYVSWYWTEFLRFRLSYQHRGGDRPEEDAVWFQVTWLFGAHPPHPYWQTLQ